MMTDHKTSETAEAKEGTGTGYLLGGIGLGACGTTLALGVGYICPVCMIGTPLLLGYGGWQKYKYFKSSKMPPKA